MSHPPSTALHIQDILAQASPAVSFEFFPPRNAEGSARLGETMALLETFAPSFVSVTYGAGGTTRQLTHDLVVRLRAKTSFHPVPHLTCVGHAEDEIAEILAAYARAGIGNLLALRGDPPRDGDAPPGAYPRAIDLVRAIRGFRGHPDARGFGIGVAGFPEGHPSTPNRLHEMDHLKAKIDAGADYICTQLFFDNRDFHDFRERCELAGIRVPILAGIMPITTLPGVHRIADLAAGARFPARLLKVLHAARGDASAIARIGIQYATEQCADLLENGVTGIHFYTLNQYAATQAICQDLGLSGKSRSRV